MRKANVFGGEGERQKVNSFEMKANGLLRRKKHYTSKCKMCPKLK